MSKKKSINLSNQPFSIVTSKIRIIVKVKNNRLDIRYKILKKIRIIQSRSSMLSSGPILAALSPAGRRGPWGREGRRGNMKRGNPKKLLGLQHHRKKKQRFVTIVTVTIYLTQVYIHFNLCTLCPSPTIHNCCAHGEDCAITQIRANTDKRAYLLTARRVGPTNSSSHRTHWMEVQG